MNKDYKMARFVNLNNKWVSYTSQEELLELYSKEIDRLNNIISELEKWCKDCILNHQIARENGDYTISDTFFEMILDKLKELKEKE